MTMDNANKVNASVLKSPIVDEEGNLLLYHIEMKAKKKKILSDLGELRDKRKVNWTQGESQRQTVNSQ